MHMQTIFFVVMTVVAFIWAVVLVKTAFNIVAAVKNRDNDDEAADETATQTAIPAATYTIAGMDPQAYYSQMNTYLH